MESYKSEEVKKLIKEAARVMSSADRHWQTGALTDREVKQAHRRVVEILAQALAAMDKDAAK